MKRFIALSVVALALSSPVVASAGEPSSPELVEQARAHHQAGTKLFNETDFAGALVEFQRAYDTVPSWRVLYDIAQTYYQLQNYAAALDAFERYLAQGGDQVAPQRRQTVEAELVELGKRVALVAISVNVAGAEIVVDDQVIGVSPLPAPVRISAGRRKVKVRKTGMIGDEKSVDVAGGDKFDLALRLTPPQTVVQVRTEGRQLLYTLAIGTGVFAVGTATFGALALIASDDWKKLRSSQIVTADQQSSAINKAKAYAITTDVLGGLTVVAGVATIYYFIKTRGDASQEKTTTSPQVGIGPRSVNLSMNF